MKLRNAYASVGGAIMSRWAEPRGMLHIIHIPAMQCNLIACILHPQGR